MVSGIVFDMDGTLVDNMNFHKKAWFNFLNGHGIPVTDDEFARKNHGIITEIVPRFFPRKLSGDETFRLGREKERIYRELYKPHVKPIEGLKEFLQILQGAGIRMALATAADLENIDFTIDALGIRSYFSAITGSEEVKFGKPNPEVYTLSAHKLQVASADCVAFEDSTAGIESAQLAGMRVVALTTTHNREELAPYNPVKIIDNYRQISLNEL
jgi:beta-phosphoglucomutase